MTNENIEKEYLDTVMEYFDRKYIDYNDNAIKIGFINDVIQGKENLRTFLGTDKVLAGEAYEIREITKEDIFSMGLSAGYDADFIYLTFAPIAIELFSNDMSTQDNKIVKFRQRTDEIEKSFKEKVERYLLESDKEKTNKKFQRIYKEGIKTSKLLAVIFGNEKLDIAFSKIQQSCHKLPIYLGVRPIDFITMSDGNSWSSCQSIENEGCYSAAPCCLGADNVTIIAWAGEEEEKEWRQMWFVDVRQKVILSSRAYTNVNTSASNLIEKFLTKLMFGEDNKNILRETEEDVRKYHFTGNDCFYHDVLCGFTDGVISITEKSESEEIPRVVVGAEGHCLLTADVLDFPESPYAGGGIKCEDCGDRIYEDEAYYIGDGKYVCEECFNRTYDFCENCGEIYRRDEMEYISGSYYCEGCAAELDETVLCEDCRDVIFKEDAIEQEDGTFLCSDCKRYRERNEE